MMQKARDKEFLCAENERGDSQRKDIRADMCAPQFFNLTERVIQAWIAILKFYITPLKSHLDQFLICFKNIHSGLLLIIVILENCSFLGHNFCSMGRFNRKSPLSCDQGCWG